jgi:hypothetical protein
MPNPSRSHSPPTSSSIAMLSLWLPPPKFLTLAAALPACCACRPLTLGICGGGSVMLAEVVSDDRGRVDAQYFHIWQEMVSNSLFRPRRPRLSSPSLDDMSNDNQKADQIAFHFYTKLFYIVNHARATAEPRLQPKVDKWVSKLLIGSPDDSCS